MATPYFQFRTDSVPSTQDMARERVEDLPLLVIAASQTRGRGRSGSGWENADRSLAASLALPGEQGDRPLSLIAGVAAVRALGDVELKWPNDLMANGRKLGGILVERSGGLAVIGMGVNLWWSGEEPEFGGLYDDDPGPEKHAELGALWGAELLELLAGDGWPLEEYKASCATLGQEITWEPDGKGTATDVSADGSLVVATGAGEDRIYSGAVRHVRPA